MKRFLVSIQVLVQVLILSFSVSVFAKDVGIEALRSLPIQDGGRIKPLDTFARETMSLVYGKEKFEGKPAVEVMMTWLLQPQAWENRALIEIRHGQVKKNFGFDENKRYFSVNEILKNTHLSLLMQELQSKRESKDKLDPYFQALQRLESQVGIFRAIATGEALRLVPPMSIDGADSQNDGVSAASPMGMRKKVSSTWLTFKKWTPQQESAFSEVAKAFVGLISQKMYSENGKENTEESASLLLKEKIEAFKKLARTNQPSLYPDETKIQTEITFHDVHPFQKSWILYLIAALSITLFWILKSDYFYKASWVFAVLGLIAHIAGFVFRVYLTGRAPVSNMYESVVWVSFGAMVFSLGIEYFYRWRFILFAGSIVSAGCLLLADNAPVVLDPSLQPLQAVLNSNFWLTSHVLTITISYAAFFLAFALGDIALFFYLKGENENNAKVKAITLGVYRAMQVGVAFLAPGIILGGIWADYSWGRFWGWDPKETWALIALLGYIAVLHGRIAGLIRSFGLVVSSIVAFSLVIMAWYGVNYILGAGLHSYGFGAGGVEYVAIFVGVHFLYVIFVSVVKKSRGPTAPPSSIAKG